VVRGGGVAGNRLENVKQLRYTGGSEDRGLSIRNSPDSEMDQQNQRVKLDYTNLIHDLAKEEENMFVWASVLQEIRAASHLLLACQFSHVH
jgi:hypothetical protein